MNARTLLLLQLYPLISWMVGADQCSVHIAPDSPTARYGDPVILNCTTSCANPARLDWETPIFKVTERGPQWVSLNISNFSGWDSQPLCYVRQSAGGPALTQTVDLIFYTLSSPRIHMKEVMVAQLDEQILCNVSSLVAGSTPSDLNVTLSRGSLVLNRSRGASVEYNLRVAPEHHKMELLCEAELRVREQSFSQRTSAVLQVQYGPTDVGVTSDRRSFAIGDNITVRCSGDSNPPAEYAWNFPADGSAELAADGRSLVVRSATERDIGTYECIVGNSLGRNRSHVVILLSKGPGGGPPAWAVALIVAAGVASGVVLVALSFRFLRR